MSRGYFQSLAASARANGSAIRPLTGSLFAPPATRVGLETYDGVPVVTAADKPAPRPHPAAESPLAAPAPPTRQSDAPGTPSPPQLVLASTDHQSSQRPVLQSSQSDDARPWQTAPVSEAQREVAQIARAEKPSRDTATTTRDTSAAILEAAPEFRPEQARPAAPPPATLLPVAPRAERAAPFHLQRIQPPPQSDQVEIHIGRIEITAVQAPAPAARRHAERKSLDLGEYLKSRDGRAS